MLQAIIPSSSNDKLISNLCFLVTFLLALQSSMTRQSENNHRGRSRQLSGGQRRPTFLCPCPVCVHARGREIAGPAAGGSQSAGPNTDNNRLDLEVVPAVTLDELEADIEAQINDIITPAAEPIGPLGPPLQVVPLASIPPPSPPPPPQHQVFGTEAAARPLNLMGILMPPPPRMVLPAKRSFSQIRGAEEKDEEEARRRDVGKNDGGGENVRLFGSRISGDAGGGSVNEIRLFGKTIIIGVPTPATTPPNGHPAAPIIIDDDKEDAAAPAADSVPGGLADVDGPTNDDNKADPPPGVIAAGDVDPEPTSSKNSD